MASLARQAFPTIHVPAVNLPRPSLRGVGIGATAVFGVLLADAMINDQTRFDVESMKAIQSINFPGIDTAISFLEVLTNSSGAVALWMAAMVLLLSLRWWLPAAAMSLLPVGGVINDVIGELLVERTRPHLDELTRTSSNCEERSFPSGHVEGAVLLLRVWSSWSRGGSQSAPLRLAIQRSAASVIVATIGVAPGLGRRALADRRPRRLRPGRR